MLKVDYLKNEKSFRSKIKSIFLVSQVLSFRHTKQTSKNVADTIFEVYFDRISLLEKQVESKNIKNGQ